MDKRSPTAPIWRCRCLSYFNDSIGSAHGVSLLNIRKYCLRTTKGNVWFLLNPKLTSKYYICPVIQSFQKTRGSVCVVTCVVVPRCTPYTCHGVLTVSWYRGTVNIVLVTINQPHSISGQRTLYNRGMRCPTHFRYACFSLDISPARCCLLHVLLLATRIAAGVRLKYSISRAYQRAAKLRRCCVEKNTVAYVYRD